MVRDATCNDCSASLARNHEQALRALEVELDLRVLAAGARELRLGRTDVQFGIDSVESRERLIAMHADADFDEPLRNATADAESDGALVAGAEPARLFIGYAFDKLLFYKTHRAFANELSCEPERENQQNRRRRDARSVAADPQRPERMDDAVDRLDHDPQPRDGLCDRPLPPHRPEETPGAEGDEHHVEHDEAALGICG